MWHPGAGNWPRVAAWSPFYMILYDFIVYDNIYDFIWFHGISKTFKHLRAPVVSRRFIRMLHGFQDLLFFKPRARQNLGPFLRRKGYVNQILRGLPQEKAAVGHFQNESPKKRLTHILILFGFTCYVSFSFGCSPGYNGFQKSWTLRQI